MIDKEKIKKDPNFDVDKFVKSELESGESPENIKFKLKNMDVNMLNIIKREGLEEKYLMEYIINKKNQGISNEDLELDLMKNYGIDSHTKKILELKLKNKAKKNYTYGIVFAIIGIGIFIYSFSKGGISILSLIIISAGIWELYKANKLTEK